MMHCINECLIVLNTCLVINFGTLLHFSRYINFHQWSAFYILKLYTKLEFQLGIATGSVLIAYVRRPATVEYKTSRVPSTPL